MPFGIPFVVLSVAVLLLAVSLVTPLAARWRLPSSVLLALIGIAIGALAVVDLDGDGPARLTAVARAIVDLPASSNLFLYVFLPMLLFNSALATDPRAMAEDAVPVFVLAVVAVVVATFVIGLALWPVSGLPLVACLLVAAIVATTDPSAVLSLFRDLGAPQRLIRLVEGESLLNDAAAIALFSVFVEAIVSGRAVDPARASLVFVTASLGGTVLGYAGGRGFALLMGTLRDNRLVQMSISLAAPYLVYVVGEALGVSGVVAVVATGLTLAAHGPARLRPDAWRYVQGTWDQLGFWAESLVFILAAMIVPRLLGDLGLQHLWQLAILVAGALGARALILFGLLPALSWLRLSPRVSNPFRVMLLWGGLRGAATLALALAVTEHPGVPEAVQSFVAILATGFVLFTLLVQGPTLRPLMRLFHLDTLGPIEASLRRQTLRVAQHETEGVVRATAERLGISDHAFEAVLANYAPGDERAAPGETSALDHDERVALGLAMLAAKERQLALEFFEKQVISPRIVDRLLSHARSLLDGTRSGGPHGYDAAAEATLRFDRVLRFTLWLHHRIGISLPLSRRLADRFETLLIKRMALKELHGFARGEIVPILGRAICDELERHLDTRQADIERELDALRLQYPNYAHGLEESFLRRVALRHQAERYEVMYEDGVVGPEVLRELRRDIARAREAERHRPTLDLGLDTSMLVRGIDFLSHLDEARLDTVIRLMKPRLAFPGDMLVRRGEEGDCAFFISSGAVEVDTGRDRIRLGRGEVFGELALLRGIRRQADVRSLSYCQLLVLYSQDFANLLARDEGIRGHVERVAQQRIEMNAPSGFGGFGDSRGNAGSGRKG